MLMADSKTSIASLFPDLKSPKINYLEAEIDTYQQELTKMRETGTLKILRPTTPDILGYKKKVLHRSEKIQTPILTDSRIGLEKTRALAEPPQELRILT